MPLHWTIDSRERLMTTIADGFISREEAENYIASVNGAGTHTYRKLFDGSRGDTRMTADDMLALGVQIRKLQTAGGGKSGPMAVVVPPHKAELLSRLLGILAAADRPMRVFSDAEPARRWIEGLPK